MTYRSEDSGSSPLQAGLYTVSQTCRVLRPSMTPRKVHYWLDTNLLGDPIRWGRPGVPTILSFEQVLKIRTLQHLRDTLRFTLQEVRKGLAWLLEALVHDQWHSLSFFRVGTGNIGVTDGEQSFAVNGRGAGNPVAGPARGVDPPYRESQVRLGAESDGDRWLSSPGLQCPDPGRLSHHSGDEDRNGIREFATSPRTFPWTS